MPSVASARGLATSTDVRGRQCPDFAQTGSELQQVVQTLFNETAQKVVLPFFGLNNTKAAAEGDKGLRKVLDMQISKGW